MPNSDETQPPMLPPDNVHPELRDFMSDMRTDMRDMKIALVGNKLGQKGIIPRLDLIEAKVDTHDRKLLVWGSVFTVAGLSVGYLKDFIFRK